MTPADARDWRALNRANWDERVGIHLGPGGYDLAPLRAGRGRLNPIEEAELGDVAGLEVLHLQCHFGADTLCLAQRGAMVTGLDFSGEAIAAARALATELGLAGRARQNKLVIEDTIRATQLFQLDLNVAEGKTDQFVLKALLELLRNNRFGDGRALGRDGLSLRIVDA